MSIPQYPETHLERYLDVMTGGKGPLPDEPENHLEVYLDYILGGSRQPEYPESRVERYLDKMAGLSEIIPTQPETRIERYLSVAVGGDGTKPTDPETRTERYLDGIADNPPRKAADNTNDTSADVPDNSLAVARIDQIGGQTIKDGTNPLKYSLPESVFNYQKSQTGMSLNIGQVTYGVKYINETNSNMSIFINGYSLIQIYGSSVYLIGNSITNLRNAGIKTFINGIEKVSIYDERVSLNTELTFSKSVKFTNLTGNVNNHFTSLTKLTNYFQSAISLIKSRLESLGYSTDVLGYSNGKTGAAWDGNYIDLVNGKVVIKYDMVDIGSFSWISYQQGAIRLFQSNNIVSKTGFVTNYVCQKYNNWISYSWDSMRDMDVGLTGVNLRIRDDSKQDVASFVNSIRGYNLVYIMQNETIIDVSDIIKGGMASRVNVEPGGTVALNTTENAGHMNITWIKAGPDPVALMGGPVRVLSDQEDNFVESEVLRDGKSEFEPLENLVSEEDLPYIVMDIEASNGLDQDA